MIRRISAATCILVLAVAAHSVEARPHYYMGPIRASHISWGPASSSGEITVAGLPAVQSARTAPGERVNRPEFGAGTSDKSSARPTGRRVYKPIRIRKRVDAASPMLRRAHAARRPLPRVMIKTRNSAGRRPQYLLWELKQARVSSYAVSGSGARATEDITLVFQEIKWYPRGS